MGEEGISCSCLFASPGRRVFCGHIAKQATFFVSQVPAMTSQPSVSEPTTLGDPASGKRCNVTCYVTTLLSYPCLLLIFLLHVMEAFHFWCHQREMDWTCER